MVEDVKEAREQLLEGLVTTLHEKGIIAARVTDLKTVAVEVMSPAGRVYAFELAAEYRPKYDWDTHMEMYDAWRRSYLEGLVDNLLNSIWSKGEQ